MSRTPEDPENARRRARAYYLAHRDEIREKQRVYKAGRREQDREYLRAYYLANREQALVDRRAWYQANREQQLERSRAWWAANHAIALERKRSWRSRNHQKVNDAGARRRARKRGAPVVEVVDRDAIIARDKSRCHLCGKKVAATQLQLDHLIPLAEGGEHSARNLAVAHKLCNLRKGTRAANDQLRMIG